MSLYALDAIMWSLGGFIAGFMTMGMFQMGRAEVDSDSTLGEKRAIERVTLRRIVAVFLIGLALLTVLVGWRSSLVNEQEANEQRESADNALALVECQMRFNAGVVDVIRDRDRVDEQGRRQLALVFQTIITALDGTSSPDEVRREMRKAMRAYIKGVEKRRKQRERLQIPATPEPNCSEQVKFREEE